MAISNCCPTAVTTAWPVATSARRVGRAPAGFSGYLRDLEAVTGNPPDPAPPIERGVAQARRKDSSRRSSTVARVRFGVSSFWSTWRTWVLMVFRLR